MTTAPPANPLSPTTAARMPPRPLIHSIALGLMTVLAIAWIAGSRGIDSATSITPFTSSLTRPRWKLRSSELPATTLIVSTQELIQTSDPPTPGPLPRWSRAAIPPVDEGRLAPDLQEVWLVQCASGWPMHALLWEADHNPRVDGIDGISTLRRGLSIDRDPLTFRSRIMPLRPIPLGLTVDWALFAVGWFLLLVIPAKMRANARARRGKCRRCGYDLTGAPSGLCPECGAVITARQSPP